MTMVAACNQVNFSATGNNIMLKRIQITPPKMQNKYINKSCNNNFYVLFLDKEEIDVKGR